MFDMNHTQKMLTAFGAVMSVATGGSAFGAVLVDEDFSGGVLPGIFSTSGDSINVVGGRVVMDDVDGGSEQLRLNFSGLPAFDVNAGSATPILRVNFDMEVPEMIGDSATSSGMRFHIRDDSFDGNYVNTFGFNFGGRITAGDENPLLDHQNVFSQEQGSFAAGGTGNFFLDGDQGTIGRDAADDGTLWRDFGRSGFAVDGAVATDNNTDGVVNVDILVNTLANTITTTLTHINSGDIGVEVDVVDLSTADIGADGDGTERFRWRTGGGLTGVYALDNIYVETLPIPEPAALSMLAAGLGLVGMRRRKG